MVAEGKKVQPSTTADNGRDDGGRFGKGNRAAKGNPFSKQLSALRATFLKCVTPGDYAKAVKMVLRKAQKGDVAAFRELSDRLFGKAKQPLEVTGGKGKPVRHVHSFDHEQFARMFAASFVRRDDGGGTTVADRN